MLLGQAVYLAIAKTPWWICNIANISHSAFETAHFDHFCFSKHAAHLFHSWIHVPFAFLCFWQPFIMSRAYKCSHCDDGCWCHSGIPLQLSETDYPFFQMYIQLAHRWDGGRQWEIYSTGPRNMCGSMCNPLWIWNEIYGKCLIIKSRCFMSSFFALLPQYKVSFSKLISHFSSFLAYSRSRSFSDISRRIEEKHVSNIVGQWDVRTTSL